MLASMCGSGADGTVSLEVGDGIGRDASGSRPRPIVCREQPQALSKARTDATAPARRERPRETGELFGYSKVPPEENAIHMPRRVPPDKPPLRSHFFN